MFHIFCYTVIKSSHKDTQMYHTNVWPHDWLLYIKRKWIIIMIFVPIVFMLTRLRRRRKKRGWYWCFRDGRGRIGGKGRRQGRHIQCNFMEIHYNFCLTFCFFISLNMFLYGPIPLPTICFGFRVYISWRLHAKEIKRSLE